jgi:hypothetical protein
MMMVTGHLAHLGLRLGSALALTSPHALCYSVSAIRKSLPSLSPSLFVSSLSRLWNCAHEFERPPAHVQVGTQAPVITHALFQHPVLPYGPTTPLSTDRIVPMFLTCLAAIRLSLPQAVTGPLAYPTLVVPSSATSTDDRACSVICRRNAGALDMTRIPLVPFDIFQMFNVPALVPDTLRLSPVHHVLRLDEAARSERSSQQR